MATLSTLELMLHELQTQENLDRYADHGKMPMLPQRPVSKARIPTNRARRAVLSFHFQEFGGKRNEEFVASRIKNDEFEFLNGGIDFSKNVMKNGGEEEEKGIIGIQKCFRGYQARSHYHKLKDAIITLQSFIRGEKARKEFQISTKRLMQTHYNEFVWKPTRDRETTIIYLQSAVRAWLTRRHISYTENTTIKDTKEADELDQESIEKMEHVRVSGSYIRNVEQEVIRAEDALRRKKHEHFNLEFQIQQINKKWELHNAQMNSKEKIWQDEYTSIQTNLESARETTANEITRFPENPIRRQDNHEETNVTIRQILELQENDWDFQASSTIDSRKGHKRDLRKLKGRFKEWVKNFQTRLTHVKKTLDRFEDDKNRRSVHKTCFLI